LNLLLIHGALGAASQLEPLQEALSRRHDVHLIELEGHGNTPLTVDAYSIPRFVAQVREFLRERRLERTGIFGYSMGGYVALQFAAESPEMVTSVATLGTKFAWTPEVAERETSRLDPVTIRSKVPKFAEQLEERHRGAGGWEAVLARTAILMKGLGERPLIDAALLASIVPPARLMVGERDNVVSRDETEAAAKNLAHGECVVLPATPHPIEQVRVSLATGALTDFFRSV
jgi:pimeloyl-ACP methyl ester carboxylesterase